MRDVKPPFFAALGLARPIVAAPEVRARWDRPSALAEFTVRGLAGHLVRMVANVAIFLDQPAPGDEPIPAPAYFATLVTSADPASPANVRLREQGEAQAAPGHAALVRELDALTLRLREVLAREPEGRPMRAAGGLVVRLSDYLVSRLVEITVHVDDLALSAGLSTPRWPREVADLAIGHLVDVARFRHGDVAVLRALARRERDDVQALRVF